MMVKVWYQCDECNLEWSYGAHSAIFLTQAEQTECPNCKAEEDYDGND